MLLCKVLIVIKLKEAREWVPAPVRKVFKVFVPFKVGCYRRYAAGKGTPIDFPMTDMYGSDIYGNASRAKDSGMTLQEMPR